jgi:predicted metal-binding membrane protein
LFLSALSKITCPTSSFLSTINLNVLDSLQSPPNKKRKLEKSRKPLSFTLQEAGLKELRAKASAKGCRSPSGLDSITALLEKTLTNLRVRAPLHEDAPQHDRI